jgi:hypothetical protein
MYQSEFFLSFSYIKILEKINKRLAKLFKLQVFFFKIPNSFVKKWLNFTRKKKTIDINIELVPPCKLHILHIMYL